MGKPPYVCTHYQFVLTFILIYAIIKLETIIKRRQIMSKETMNQRATKMTLLKKVGGWKRYQINAFHLALKGRVSCNVMYTEEVVILGEIEKYFVAKMFGTGEFTKHKILGYDNPRLHWHPMF